MSEMSGEQIPVPPPPAPGVEPGVPGPRPGVPWGPLDAVGVVAVTIPAALVLGGLVALAAGLLGLPDAVTGLLLPLPLVVLAVVSAVWVQVRFGAARELVGPARGRLVEWLLGGSLGAGAFLGINIVLGIVLQILAGLGGMDLPEPQEDLRRLATDPSSVPWLLLAAVVFAPIAEEVFFRGLLYQGLRRRIGVWGAALSSAGLFAAAHMLQEGTLATALVAFVLILPLGVLLAVVFERRGTLATPIAMHAAFNGVTAAFMILGSSGGVVPT